MSVTIDHTGRLVIPKKIRDEMNLVAGSELEIDSTGDEIRLRIPTRKTRLVENDGFFVFTGSQKSNIDIADFIISERDKVASTFTSDSP